MDDPDFSFYELWSKVYTQLHIAFAEKPMNRARLFMVFLSLSIV